MQGEQYREFEKRVYKYCDNNVGREILFTGFAYLWPQNHDIAPKDLAILTSKIINDLAKKGVLKEISKKEDFDIPYGMYEILPHEMLIKDNK